MIYLFENPENYASIVYDETSLTEEHKAKGIAVVMLPEKDVLEGKMATLKCRKSTGEVWWEYEDIPKAPEEIQQQKIQELENALLEMSTLQAIKDAENEQAIMELTNLIGGMM
ncbi:hypothetical protein [Tissierella creatinophila]|uniref:Uncharacterized protein n=1 Tax=Tissierella creatinophila DSM 6911 TaxID=1123403 RepID=A0A1U7M6C1_TISCR|nr:hypothetical protein [Tissierella creatinophila]OLS02874.1 hypothetical protein TICRE_11470 [Tissierella creatinophila DSM 6911]